jgi:hypothetical protein
MKTTNPVITDLIDVLRTGRPDSLRIVLPNGDGVPSHFHVTEVGRVQKDFMDCGGTIRRNVNCQLQLLVATDFEHRLSSGKLLKIVEMSGPVLGDEPLPLTVEYGQKFAVVYSVQELDLSGGVLKFTLGYSQTACLAADTCGLPTEMSGQPVSLSTGGCAPGTGCC